jgi:hypothetical protein
MMLICLSNIKNIIFNFKRNNQIVVLTMENQMLHHVKPGH